MRACRGALTYLAFLVVLLAVQRVFAEGFWLSMLTLGLPQPIWLLPALVLLPIALVRRNWLSGTITLVSIMLVVFAFLGPSFGTPSPGEPHLRVMSLNVKRFEEASPADIVEVIKREDPDVVCLQEAIEGREHFRTALFRLLPDYEFAEADEVPILSRFPILSRRRTRLSDLPTWRPANEVLLQVGPKQVRILNVHLQAFPWNDPRPSTIAAAASSRMRQAKQVAELLASAGRTVLCGDFNTIPQTKTYRVIASHADDAFAVAGTGFGFTLPARFPMRRIDYIFTRELEATGAYVGDAIVSDHRAVVADLRVGAESAR